MIKYRDNEDIVLGFVLAFAICGFIITGISHMYISMPDYVQINKEWRKACRNAGGTVIEDYRGYQECRNPKVKVINN